MLITSLLLFSQSDIYIIESIYQQWYILDGLGMEASEVCKITRIPASWSHNISTHPVWQLHAWYIILLGIPQCKTDHKLFMPKIPMKSHFRGIFLGVKTARGGMQSCRNCSHSRARIGVSFDISMIRLSCKNVEFPIFWTLTSFDVMISAQKASCVSIEMNLGFDLFRCASISYNHVGHSVIKSVMVSRFCHLRDQSSPTGGKA